MRTTRRPAMPSLNGVSLLLDALDEVGQLRLAALRSASIFGRPHVARAITDQQIVNTFAAVHLHASVVDLDLLVGSRSFQTSIFFSPPISVVRTFTGESQFTLMCAITLFGK